MRARSSSKALSTLCIAAALSGCVSAEKPASTTQITTLRTRNGFIEIRTGSNGRTYALLDAHQNLIDENLTAEELKARYPNQYESLERGIAGDGAPLLDASGPGRTGFSATR